MNIYAKPGDKVRFLGENGHDYELKSALSLLSVGQEYEVLKTEAYNWSSEVWLKGFDCSFNTVMFEDAQTEAGDASNN